MPTPVSTFGKHCILELYGCPGDLLDDLDRVREALAEAAREAKSTILGINAHRFEPQGVTALGLLAESHISVHTWPELGYAAADVFTCGEHCIPERACEVLARLLEAERADMHRLVRGDDAPKTKPQRIPAPEPSATWEPPPDQSSAG